MDTQPLSEEILNDQALEKFKPPPPSKFDGMRDPRVPVLTINNQMAIIGSCDSLKYKLTVHTLTEASLRWYMELPKHLVTSYQDLVKKLTYQFWTIKHMKVSKISLFNVRYGEGEILASTYPDSARRQSRSPTPTRKCLLRRFRMN